MISGQAWCEGLLVEPQRIQTATPSPGPPSREANVLLSNLIKAGEAKPGLPQPQEKKSLMNKNKRRWVFTPAEVQSSQESRASRLPHILAHTVLSAASVIIVLRYCCFFTASSPDKINESQAERWLNAGLFTHGWTRELRLLQILSG